MASVDYALEHISLEGSSPASDHALHLPLRCEDSQDLIESDHYLTWDELLGLR